MLMLFFGIFPIDDKKIVLSSYFSSAANDNPYEIYTMMQKNCPEYHYIWLIREPTAIEGARVVRAGTVMSLYHLATAKCWIDNSRKRSWVVKRKKQYYVQTWHGCYPLKKIEKDAEASLPLLYLKSAKNDSKMADLMVSGSVFFTETIHRAFWYDGEIMECGSPRMDSLFNPRAGLREEMRDRFSLAHNQRIVLYAPTFRANYSLDCYKLDCTRLIEELNKREGANWTVLMRLHPNISDKSKLIQYTDNILNASKYADINDLITAADIIITDYSSLMFEAGVVGKPVFLFATDVEEYKKDRGFYFELDELPFPLAQSNDELIDNIKAFDRNAYDRKMHDFYIKMHPFENGTASKQVADRIEQIMKE